MIDSAKGPAPPSLMTATLDDALEVVNALVAVLYGTVPLAVIDAFYAMATAINVMPLIQNAPHQIAITDVIALHLEQA